MAATVLAWLYVSLLAYIFGVLTLDLGNFIYKPIDKATTLPTITFFIGLAALSGLVSYLFIFINLGFIANLIALSIALFYCILRYQFLLSTLKGAVKSLVYYYSVNRISSGVLLLAGFGFGILLLFRSSIAVFNTDTSIYHLQVVQWAVRYSAIPGLGNLFHRLAFNSQWLSLNAFFSFSFWGNCTGWW